MIVYEIETDDGEEASYYPSLKEAKKAAVAFTKEYEPDEEGWGGIAACEAEIYRFDFKPTKENVIAALNRLQWRPKRQLVARFKDGKMMK